MPARRRAAPAPHATKTRGVVRGRRQEAVEAEGHRPRARRAAPARRSGPGGGDRSSVRSRATTRTGCRRSARRAALRSALAARHARGQARRGRRARARRAEDEAAASSARRASASTAACSSWSPTPNERVERAGAQPRRTSRCCRVAGLNVYDVLQHQHLVLTRDGARAARGAAGGGGGVNATDVVERAAHHREGHARERDRQSGRLPGATATRTRSRSGSAVETLFKVKVEKVRTADVRGKTRRVGRSHRAAGRTGRRRT